MKRVTRPLIGGPRHVVAAGHYLAAAAGHAVLEAGGNAVDAGCAAGLTLGVVQPDLVNVAGVAPIMIRPAQGPVVTIDGLGTWPASLPDGYFMERHGGIMPEGVERAVVPAALDAWLTALESYGTMSFSDIAAWALRFAHEGFPAHDLMIGTITTHRDGYARWPSSAEIFLPGGAVPRPGQLFVQSDLARTLAYLCQEEQASSGSREDGIAAVRRAFYEGDVAAAITGFVAGQGGFLSRADMAGFRVRVEEPVSIVWRGHVLNVCGPWCQGPVLAMALRQIEEMGLDGYAHNAPETIHVLCGILDNVFADRDHHFADPAFNAVPLAQLLSGEHARARLAQIDPARAREGMPGPLIGTATSTDSAADHSRDPQPPPDTSYVAVVDRFGNAFSATPSDGTWDMPVVPGTGLTPSSRGSQSRPDPAHPAGARAGRRPRLTPNPAMLVSGDDVMPFGTPGGDVQSQAMLQLLLNRFHYGMSLQEAVEAPRFATYNFPGSFAPYTYHPNLIMLEEGIGEETRAALEARGHRASFWPDLDWRAGGLCAVESDRKAGLIFGAADPRRPAYAIAG